MQLHCEFVYMAGRSKIPQMFLVLWGRGEKCALSSSFHPLPPPSCLFRASVKCHHLLHLLQHETILMFFITSIHLSSLSPWRLLCLKDVQPLQPCAQRSADVGWMSLLSRKVFPDQTGMHYLETDGEEDKKRIKRTEFHSELELGITFDHVTTVQNDLFFRRCSYCHPCI